MNTFFHKTAATRRVGAVRLHQQKRRGLLLLCTCTLWLLGASCERKGSVSPQNDCLAGAIKDRIVDVKVIMRLQGSPRAPETTWYIVRENPNSLPLVICGETPKTLQVEGLPITFSGETQTPAYIGRGAFGYVKLEKYSN